MDGSILAAISRVNLMGMDVYASMGKRSMQVGSSWAKCMREEKWQIMKHLKT